MSRVTEFKPAPPKAAANPVPQKPLEDIRDESKEKVRKFLHLSRQYSIHAPVKVDRD